MLYCAITLCVILHPIKYTHILQNYSPTDVWHRRIWYYELVSHIVWNLFTILRLLLIRVTAPLLSSISLDRLYVIILSLSLSPPSPSFSFSRKRAKDVNRSDCQFLGRTIMIGFTLLFISLSRSLSVIGHYDLSLRRESSPSWESRSIWITTKGIAAGKRIAFRGICHRRPGGWACCVTVTWPGKCSTKSMKTSLVYFELIETFLIDRSARWKRVIRIYKSVVLIFTIIL